MVQLSPPVTLSEELMPPPSPSYSDVICEGCPQQRAGERHNTAAEWMVLLQSSSSFASVCLDLFCA